MESTESPATYFIAKIMALQDKLFRYLRFFGFQICACVSLQRSSYMLNVACLLRYLCSESIYSLLHASSQERSLNVLSADRGLMSVSRRNDESTESHQND